MEPESLAGFMEGSFRADRSLDGGGGDGGSGDGGNKLHASLNGCWLVHLLFLRFFCLLLPI